MNKNFDTPILLLLFNRPKETKQLWKEIKKLKPKNLYIAMDGPRKHITKDKALCKEVKDIIFNDIDWECNIEKLIREENLGCGLAIKSALEWFFSKVEEGIILEDDCIPHPDFFDFCTEMLERYKNEEKVFMISGNSVDETYTKNLKADYYFTHAPNVWGWATWRRSMKKYDFYLEGLDDFKSNKTIEKIYQEKEFQNFWIEYLDEIKNKKINNWDYQMAFSCFKEESLCVRPRYNLVTNIGTTLVSYGKNTCIAKEEGLKVKTHPTKIEVDKKADTLVMRVHLNTLYRVKKILKKLKAFEMLKYMYKRLTR